MQIMNTVRERLAVLARNDDGDVPGWVLITLMTAGLPVRTRIGRYHAGA